MNILKYFRPLFRWRFPVIRWGLRIQSRLRYPLARLWRPLMFHTTFIAVCGSVGKTTTKELIAAILAQDFSVAKTNGTWGGFKFGGVAGTILSVRPWHQFAVVEVAIESKGQMAKMAQLVKPDIVVMLAVRECHIMEFKNLESVAAEKSEILKALSTNGIAILNGEDPIVSGMSEVGSFKVIKFGFTGQDISVVGASSEWPLRLHLTLQEAGKKYSIESRLVGVHWSNSILAAVTTATQCGVPLRRAIPAVEAFEPFWARMQPVLLDNGVTYIRDEWNGSYDTMLEAFRVLKESSAKRKIAIVSEYSDSHNSEKPRQKIRRIAREISLFMDIVIFVGKRAHYGKDEAIKMGVTPESAFTACSTEEAAIIIKKIQQPGDLILLKGKTSDHLSRIYLSQLGTVTCKLEKCSRQILCDRCGALGFVWEKKYTGLMAPPEVIV